MMFCPSSEPLLEPARFEPVALTPWRGATVLSSQRVEGVAEWTGVTQALQGSWVNADCPNEQYMVDGQRVTRTDTNGTRYFTLQWDDQRKQLLWGTHGRLHLAWLPDGIVAWMPARLDSKVWRWRRVMPLIRDLREHRSPGAAWRGRALDWAPVGAGGYGPWTKPRAPATAGFRPWAPPRAGGERARGADSRGGFQEWPLSENGGWEGRGWQPMPMVRHRQHPYAGHRAGPWRRAAPPGGDRRLQCGLASSEVYDLLFREITPDDYETLLRLDDTVARPTASASSVEALPCLKGGDFLGEECSVCLGAFEAEDVITELPKCRHRFHRGCISKWLSECKKKCPLCGDEAPLLSEDS